MKEIVKDINLVACCGLYCGACGAYLRGRCPGCRENAKAKWCKVRTCCIENSYSTCGACQKISDVNDCRHFNSRIAKIVGFLLNGDIRYGIKLIRENGLDRYAEFMADNRLQKIPRRGKNKGITIK